MDISEKLIEKHWSIMEVKFEETLHEVGNRVVKLFSCREGRFVYKTMDDWYTNADLTERLKIFDFLNQRNFKHIPILIKTREGNLFQEIENKFVLILEYIEGKEPEKTRENYEELGRIMGELNNITDYPHPALVTVDAVRPLFAEMPLKLDPSIRKEFLEIANSLPDIDKLPHSLIHFEIILGRNNIQKSDGTIVFLDWDEAGGGATVLDPGYALINGFVSEDLEFDKENAKIFYDSYLATHPLTQPEKEMMFDASLFHALRYLEYSPEKRWRRIKWALENRSLLESLYM